MGNEYWFDPFIRILQSNKVFIACKTTIFIVILVLITSLSAGEAKGIQTSGEQEEKALSSRVNLKIYGNGNEFQEPQQSRTGPTPPKNILEGDLSKVSDQVQDIESEVTLPTPAYIWRHGCGPTALAMVVGYYDTNGFDDLISGSATSQTSAVDQAIASGGNSTAPFPPGSERHYEDYARPQDSYPNLLTDDYLTSIRTPHTDDSLADYMDTSKSTRSNYYGWSWSSDMGPAFVDYVNQQNSTYLPSYQSYYFSNGSLTWAILTSEIDAGRPMVFLVDTDGNGGTDHFVTVIGYRDSPSLQYASMDTWYTNIRWENFTGMIAGVPWGIWGGWSFSVSNPEISYELTVNKDGDGDGVVLSDPEGIDCGGTCTGMFSDDTEVTLTANADTDSIFGGWSGACTNASGPCVVTMTETKQVTATFTAVSYELTANKDGDGGGVVSSDPVGIDCGSICTGMFSDDTEVTLTANADTDSIFGGWSGACTNASGPCVVTMTEAKQVTATFTKIAYELTVNRDGDGGGVVSSDPEGIDCGSTCTGMFIPGKVVILTTNADTDSIFGGWSGACTNASGPCVVTMTEAKQVTVTFTKIAYELTVNKDGDGGGVVSSDPVGIDCGMDCTESYADSTVVTLTASADTGSTFVGWSGACTNTSGICVVTMSEAKDVTAAFTLNQNQLSVSLSGTGGGLVSSAPAGISCSADAGSDCTEMYDYGTPVTLTATADTGSIFTGWSGGGCSDTVNCVVTMSQAQSVTAVFTLDQHTLSVSLAGTGSGSVGSTPAGIDCGTFCTESYDYGTIVTLTATTDPGSAFEGWSRACSGISDCTVTMTETKAVTATFKATGVYLPLVSR